MRDVGIALWVADDASRLMNKTQLQKFIYLMDVISPLYQVLFPKDNHRTYQRGPYDQCIQNAVDALAFRGFVRIARIAHISDGTTSASYGLTACGQEWVSRMSAAEGFSVRMSVGDAVGKRIGAVWWDRIIELVYAEPTFVAARPRGYGQQLVPNDGLTSSSAYLTGVMADILKTGFANPTIDRELLLDLFFEYLAEYASTVIA
jgi:hypothetical protein